MVNRDHASGSGFKYKVKKGIFSNIVSQVLSNSVLAVASFLLITFIGRYWGVEKLGIYSFIVLFISLFSFSFNWGIDNLFVREFARQPEKVTEWFSISKTIIAGLSLITLIIIVSAGSIINKNAEVLLALFIGSAWAILESWTNVIRSIFYAREEMHIGTIFFVIEKLLALFLVLPYLQFSNNLIGLFSLLLFSRIISYIAILNIFEKRYGKVPFNFCYQKIKHLLYLSTPFAINLALTPVYSHSDSILLSIIKGDEGLGYFRAASSIVLQLPIIATALNNAVYPRFSRQWGEKDQSYEANKLLRYMAILSFPLTAFLCILAEPTILLLYTPEFKASIDCLRILAFMLPFSFLNASLGMMLTSSGLQKLRTKVVLVTVFSKIVLSLIFIPLLGEIGASISSLGTLVILSLLLFISVNKNVCNAKISIILKPLISSVVLGLCLFALRGYPLWVPVILAGPLYATLLLLSGGVEREEVSLIKKFLIEGSLKKWA